MNSEYEIHLRFFLLATVLCILTLFLSGCGAVGDIFQEETDPVLTGERISILDLQSGLEPDDKALDAQGFIAPQAWKNEFWPQAGGYPNHAMQNLALNEDELEELWSVSIGQGSTKEIPLTAQPIVVDGQIFTIDTDATLSAFNSENGKRLWRTDVRTPGEDDEVIGGGIAYSWGKLYVTNGYNELLAVSPEDGAIFWRVDLPGPARAAPTVMNERIFVSTLDNRLLALNRENGEVLWEFSGISETAGLVGAASPAVDRDIVIPAFSSGELFALRIENGSVAWGENLASFRQISGLSSIADIRGLPVIDRNIVIAISFGGRMAAIETRSGSRIWTREIGGSETPWVVGNHVFVINSENELVALGRDNGVIRWVTQLPEFKDQEARKGAIYWTGPVLGGSRLIAVSSSGLAAEVNPETGKLIRQWNTGKSVKLPPVIADGTLYLVSEDGKLTAYK